jgi:hypothetical protein
MLSCMRFIAVVAVLSACIHRVDVTFVTLRDPSDLAVDGSGAVPQVAGTGATGLVDHDVVLVGRPSDVLAFDGDTLHMHLTRDEARYCRHGQRCDRRVLDLRIATPLANVRSIHAVGVVANHELIPLGVLAGSLLTGFGGGTLAYELAEREHVGAGPAPIMLAVGIAILAVEIHARLARDTVTVVR